jgi:hypothetical protein
VKIYSAYFHPAHSMRTERPPVLVKEGISWSCLVLGWIGLLLRGSWIAAFLVAAASVVLAASAGRVAGLWPVLAGLQLLLALFAHDLCRWELRLRGFVPGPIVAGHNAEAALLRLLDCRPELIGGGA